MSTSTSGPVRIVHRIQSSRIRHRASPEMAAGTAQLPDATALNGELIVWESGRLQGRLQRRGAGAVRLTAEWPAHFVAFDLLRIAGTDTMA
ncbi:DNA ligase-like domain-containing protein [Streptomyces europaeiscabiei]|uniref:hypothetical protein n=1 Tax=Streptomyces europaeiscabiei TaxID=146819 RepID=UPI0038F6B474